GLPSECVLLFSAADVVKQTRFIEEKNEQEQRVAHEQLRQMVHFSETRECRRTVLLRYFGEERPNESCNGCDNCLTPRETFDGTIAAQKFLSCVHRVQQKSGFGFGLNHIVEVLLGAKTEAVRQRGHDQLSTYGIGSDMKRENWQAIGRELLRLGLVEAAPGKFATLQLTEAGFDALRKRTTVTLTKPADVARKTKSRAGAIECDEVLFDRLRSLRRKLADEADVPAYVIFSDAALREMAAVVPRRLGDFARISGVGEQKLKKFGEAFVAEIDEYAQSLSSA
ncbi:MAG: HRDC domain-containing protein, partial [Verrucomicrobiota bacterium]|nr:HRDC domain-containing protein [Verrucomicrobiota bacterium]